MASPKVLQVCAIPDGGAPEHVLRLSEGLASRGWVVHVLCPPGWLARAARDAGLGVAERRLTRLPHLRSDLSALVGLVRTIRHHRYDVVHAHSAKAGAIARLAARLAGVPCIYTPHAWPFLADSGRVARSLWTAIERIGARLGDGIICVSNDERRSGEQARALGGARVAVIPNGVATPAVAVRAREHDALVVGAVARLRRQKGLDVLVDAAATVVEKLPKTRFVIVGDGPLKEEVRARAARLGLGDAIEIWDDQVGTARAALPSFDVFALPSRWEGMPIALLEACAAGLPCVATDVGGVREIIEDGAGGRVVPPDDARHLATALIEALSSVDIRRSWGAAARRRVSEDFGIEGMVNATELFYLEVALADEI